MYNVSWPGCYQGWPFKQGGRLPRKAFFARRSLHLEMLCNIINDTSCVSEDHLANFQLGSNSRERFFIVLVLRANRKFLLGITMIFLSPDFVELNELQWRRVSNITIKSDAITSLDKELPQKLSNEFT